MLTPGEDWPKDGVIFVDVDDDKDAYEEGVYRLIDELEGVFNSADPKAYMDGCYPDFPKDIERSKDRRNLKKYIPAVIGAGMFASILAFGFTQYCDYGADLIRNIEP
jgi:hypothetical protein